MVAVRARGLIADTGKVLLDREMDAPVVEEIREVVSRRGADSETMIADLHVWRVGKGSYSCALSLVAHDERLTPKQVREWLSVHEEIVHSTIEINRCPAGPAQAKPRAPQRPEAAFDTKSATASICRSLNWPANLGITPIPVRTTSRTRALSGFSSSSDGPIVPVAPAASSV